RPLRPPRSDRVRGVAGCGVRAGAQTDGPPPPVKDFPYVALAKLQPQRPSRAPALVARSLQIDSVEDDAERNALDGPGPSQFESGPDDPDEVPSVHSSEVLLHLATEFGDVDLRVRQRRLSHARGLPMSLHRQ